MTTNLDWLTTLPTELQDALAAHGDKYYRLARYYPDRGPLRRELYHRHLEFFRLGRTVPTRCFMAANRTGKCITGESLVDTPSGGVKAKNLMAGDVVWAWDGEKKVSSAIERPFQKPGLHECALIVMSDGRWIEAADHHRFFVSGEWRLLSECLDQSFFCHHLSSTGFSRTAHALGGLRWSGIVANWMAHCLFGLRRYDAQPPFAQGSGQEFAPSPGDVQQCISRSWRSGGLAHRRSDTPFDNRCHPSIRDVVRRHAALFVGWIAQVAYKTAAPNLRRRQAFAPLRAVAGFALRLMGGVSIPALGASPLQIGPLDTPDVDGTHIIAVIGIGRHKVYDFTVPALHCYCAAGLVHHNTEGGGGYEAVCHLTRRYPSWWEGRVFDHGINALVAGDTKETVRDIIQRKLVGERGAEGTGLIPACDILHMVYRQNGNGALDYIDVVSHAGDGQANGVSRLGFKSYDQGRQAFQGTEQDLIWLDEESDEGIRSECALRLMTTHGLLIETFTPLLGLTKVVLTYLAEGRAPDGDDRTVISGDRALVMAGWDDVPHLTADAKRRMLAEAEPHLREARSKGVPSIGSGAIYPIGEDEITCDPFVLPEWWPRAYGMDVGWKRTAAIWGAFDQESDTWYLYSEHYRGQAEPSIHADAIKNRGDWIPGVIDPASRGRSQKDGEKLIETYTEDLHLDLTPADNAVEAGIHLVYQRLSSGRLKVFSTCRNWLGEYRIYRRDDKGRVVKENDHLMDCTRYLMMSGGDVARTNVRSARIKRRGSGMAR